MPQKLAVLEGTNPHLGFAFPQGYTNFLTSLNIAEPMRERLIIAESKKDVTWNENAHQMWLYQYKGGKQMSENGNKQWYEELLKKYPFTPTRNTPGKGNSAPANHPYPAYQNLTLWDAGNFSTFLSYARRILQARSNLGQPNFDKYVLWQTAQMAQSSQYSTANNKTVRNLNYLRALCTKTAAQITADLQGFATQGETYFAIAKNIATGQNNTGSGTPAGNPETGTGHPTDMPPPSTSNTMSQVKKGVIFGSVAILLGGLAKYILPKLTKN